MAAGELAGSTEFLSRLEAIYAERKRLMDQMRNSAIEGIPIAPPDTLGQVSAWADEWQSMPRAIEQHELPDLTVEEQRDLIELVSAASGLIDDVLSFSTYWGLRAWWAVPALLNALFIRGEDGSFDAAFFFTGKPWWHAPQRLVVPLPHRSQAAFERDRDRLLVAEHHDRHLRDGQEVVIERRLRGHELRALQWQIDSAAVAYDWDPDDPPTEAPWGFFAEAGLDLTDEPDLSYDPTRVIEIESEARLGRSLTYREGRQLRGAARPQIEAANRVRRDQGWVSKPQADSERDLRWTALRLLKPDWSLEDLTNHIRSTEGNHPDDEPYYQLVQQAVERFASRAQLDLSGKFAATSAS